MAALLHDLVDSTRHSSKLGHSLRIPDPYVQWLCAHHHDAKDYPANPDLRLLQEADVRTSRYARLLQIPTSRRKLAPVNTRQTTLLLEHAAQISVHRLYRTILQAHELNQFTASKAYPTETLRTHLLGVANWVLFWLRTRSHDPLAVSTALTGEPGGTPGPVEMEDRSPRMNHNSVVRAV